MTGIEDLKKIIDTHEMLLKNYVLERDRLIRLGAPKGYSSGTSYLDADCIRSSVDTDFLDVADDIIALNLKIEEEENIINGLKEDIKKITYGTENLNDVNTRLMEKRYVLGKTIKQIALEENYSYDYLKLFYCRKRRQEVKKNVK